MPALYQENLLYHDPSSDIQLNVKEHQKQRKLLCEEQKEAAAAAMENSVDVTMTHGLADMDSPSQSK